MPAGAVPVRDAASIVILRRDGSLPRVLMGRRPAASVFLPGKYVFPGGAVDAADAQVTLAAGPGAVTLRRAGPLALSLAAAAIRELWEETGLILGRRASWPAPAPSWAGFAARGYRPDAGALRLILRAITPEGLPRRFDARFFLADATALADLPERPLAQMPPGTAPELEHLHWPTLDEADRLDLPFVTRIVLAEVALALARPPGAEPDSLPFLDNGSRTARISRLR